MKTTVKQLKELLAKLDEEKTIAVYTHDDEGDSWSQEIIYIDTEHPKYGERFDYYIG